MDAPGRQGATLSRSSMMSQACSTGTLTVNSLFIFIGPPPFRHILRPWPHTRTEFRSYGLASRLSIGLVGARDQGSAALAEIHDRWPVCGNGHVHKLQVVRFAGVFARQVAAEKGTHDGRVGDAYVAPGPFARQVQQADGE